MRDCVYQPCLSHLFLLIFCERLFFPHGVQDSNGVLILDMHFKYLVVLTIFFLQIFNFRGFDIGLSQEVAKSWMVCVLTIFLYRIP